jgi:putative phosphoribosyl transferase
MEGEDIEENWVRIETDWAELEGDLRVPEGAEGIVVFVHRSGSSRFSPRNRFVAKHLREGGLATLLMDLLTSEEDEVDRRTREYRFNIELLTERVIGATRWLRTQPEARGLKIGYFGSSTGAAAALKAAARQPGTVSAVVSRGGRPDLAGQALRNVQAPTLLIVGGADEPVIALNRQAQKEMKAKTELEIVEGAGHLFAEPGTLEQVARLARQWFVHYLAQSEMDVAGSPAGTG